MKEKTRNKWVALIAQQEASGLSIVDFCDNNQLSPKSFYNRKKDLIQSNTDSPFIKVHTTKASFERNHLKLTIGQASLQVPADVSPQWLGALLQVATS